jgi:hypothetical protein
MWLQSPPSKIDKQPLMVRDFGLNGLSQQGARPCRGRSCVVEATSRTRLRIRHSCKAFVSGMSSTKAPRLVWPSPGKTSDKPPGYATVPMLGWRQYEND